MAARSSYPSPGRGRGTLPLLLLCLFSLAGSEGAHSSDRPAPPNDLAARTDSLYEAAAYEQALRAALDGLALARTMEGPAAERLTAWLVRVAQCQIKLNRLDEAKPILDEAVAIEATRSSGPHPDAIELKRTLLWWEQGRWNPEAMLKSANDCVDLARRVYGPGDPRVARDLTALANVFIDLDRPGEAAAPINEAERLVVPAWGREHETMADILAVRAELARSKGDLAAAIVFLEQSVEIVQEQRGSDHPSLGPFLRGLGEVHRLHGDLDEAEKCFRRILDIETAAYGPGHPGTGLSLNNLGVVLKNKGDLTGAASAYEGSLAAQIAGHGENTPDVAVTMVNLSALKQAMGQEAAGIRLLRRAVAIMERTMGPEHTRTAWALSHLAQAERRHGQFREAGELFRRCLRIAQLVHGPVHPDVVLYWIGIGQCLRDEGRLEEAVSEFQKADSIGTVLFGPDSHELARYRRELGVTLLLLGRTEEARSLLEACAATIERELGPEHPALNQCLAGLTIAALRRGDYERARELADRNLATAERVFGESALRRSLLLKLAVEVAAGDWETATAHGIRAAEIALQIQDDVLQVSSEREMLLYVEHCQRVLGTLLAAIQTTRDVPDSILARAFSLAARQHGQTVDRFAMRRRLLELAADTSATRALYEQHRIASERLAACVVAGPQGKPDEYMKARAEAREAKTRAERALAEASSDPRFRIDRSAKSERLAPEDVAAQLEPGATLIQFVRFPVLSVHTEAWRPGAPSIEGALFHGREDHYGAFRLRASNPARWRIDFVDLGEAAATDTLVASYRRSIVAVPPGRRPTVRQESVYRKAARDLAQAVWTPLLGEPGIRPPGEETDKQPFVLLVPTSWLHMVDFNTLLARNGDPILESWRLHLLSSVRDLFREYREPKKEGSLLAVGNPEGVRPLGLCTDRIDPTVPLPGSEEEAREISALFRQSQNGEVVLMTGREANETAVKRRIEHAQIAHIAAHGFFCEDVHFSEGEQEEATLDPLLRCGIVLAPGTEGDDGFLTAQEIVARDLRDLDWVVLSACESGLGPLVSGEGLYGLRRAFEIAGAHTVITALWRIDDRATRDLMSSLYRNRLQGRSTVDALRAAQLDRLHRERRRNRVHPASWGGIITEGDWR